MTPQLFMDSYRHDSQAKAVITALAAVPGIGRATLLRMSQVVRRRHLSWRDIWEARLQDWLRWELQPQHFSALRFFKELFSVEAYGEHLAQQKVMAILCGDVFYPDLLTTIPDYPVVLFALGNVHPTGPLLQPLPIAIVGTRRMSSYGRVATEKITTELVIAGATIVSGFMYGVDMVAHRTALREGGSSIGVLGFGFEHLSWGQQRISQEFLEAGNVLLSEYAPATPASKGTFPMRNRIVAGLSRAVIVTEAPSKSGTFITVQCAIDYHREVGVMPGPVTHPGSEGTKKLINEGAKLVITAQDILEEVGIKVEVTVKAAEGCSARKMTHLPHLNQLEQQIVLYLRHQFLSFDQLQHELHVAPHTLAKSLSSLELKRVIQREGTMYHPLL